MTRKRNLPLGKGAGIDADSSIEGYELLGEVGRGGFGVVHRARQAGLDRDVAIKILSAGRLNDDASRRFERECRVLGKLSDHPNIVTVHGSGFTAAGQPFIAMEFLARGSLADRIAQQGKLPWQEVADHVVKVAGALETAHRAGVLHRDVKPENILLSGYGEPMLADFGIARVDDGTRTQAGAIATSLAHAAPEILDGRDPSAASDVYALASTMFQLLAGSLAFDSGDGGVVAMIGKVLHRPVPDLRPEGIPDSICKAIETGMAKDLAGRPTTAEGFGALVAEAARQAGHEVAPPRFGSVADPDAAVETPVRAATPDPTRIHARPAPAVPASAGGRGPADRPGWLVPLAAVLVVALGVGTAVALRRPAPGYPQLPAARTSPSEAATAPDPAANTGEGRVVWQEQLIEGASPALFVQALAGTVAVRRADRLDLHDLSDGSIRWSTQFTGADPAPAPALLLPGQGSMIVRHAGIAVSFDLATAVQSWRARLDAFAVMQDLILELQPSVVIARDPTTALVRWYAELPPDGGDIRVVYGPDSSALALWTDLDVFVIDPDDGSITAHHEGSQPIRAVIAAGDVLYVARSGDAGLQVESVDMGTGALTQVWSSPRGFATPRMVGVEDTVVLFDGAHLQAITADSGEVTWRVPLEIEDPLLEMTSRGVVVVDGPADAATLLRFDLYGDATPACQQSLPAFGVVPVVTDDHVHVSTLDGRQLAYDVGTCELAWSYSLPEGRVAAQSLEVDLEAGVAVLLDDGGGLTAFRLWDV